MLGPVVTDIEGTVLTEDDKRRIASPLVGMVILFTRNYTDPAQLRALCDSIHAVKPGILISVDHEGGRVQRFRKGFTRLPPLAEYGRLYTASRQMALNAAFSHGYVLAAELLACGVDFSFTPDLDINWKHSAVIGSRALSHDFLVVASLAQEMIFGLREAGMGCCGKHFPGHGWAKADSHKELPEDDRPLGDIRAIDEKPYKLLAGDLDSVMTAHVAYPEVEPGPATFSRFWIHELRQGCGFDGLVFSDDLAMGGALGAGSIVERARKALEAGCDALILCNKPEETDRLLAGLDWEPTEAFRRRSARIEPSKRIASREALSLDAQYEACLRRIPQTSRDLIDWEE